MVYEFASTSKVTYAGGGISAVASSPANLDWIKKSMTVQTIGYDKVNQLRHVRFFKDFEGVKTHMMKHADSMRPKFLAVLNVLEKELGGLGIGSWTNPNGGCGSCSHGSRRHLPLRKRSRGQEYQDRTFIPFT